jgi:hypothetical protein
MQDFEYFQQQRAEREDKWYANWKTYLTKPRRTKIPGRSNAVSPHGAQAVKFVVPLLKQLILTNDPVVTSVPRKGEMLEQARERDRLASYFLDQANFRRVVLTDMLKEALVFGIAWGFVHHRLRTRPLIQFREEQTVDDDGVVSIDFKEVRTEEITFEGPEIVYVPIEDIYYDPAERMVNDDMTIIHRFFRTKKELMDDGSYMRDKVEKLGSGNPQGSSRTQIDIGTIFEESRRRVLGMDIHEFRRTNDRMRAEGDEIIELHQVTSRGQLFTVANRGVVVREESLDIPNPWFDMTVDPIPGEIGGKGLFDDNISTLEQRDFLVNAIYDNMANLVHGKFKGIPGMYDKKSLRGGPGSVIKVRNMDALERLEQGDIVAGAYNVLALLDREWERGSGISELLGQVGAGAGTVYPETATVGQIKNRNAQAFLIEQASHVETSLVSMMKKIWDLEREFWSPGQQLRLACEKGADFIMDIGVDTLARDVDFKFLGPRYGAQREEQVLAYERAAAMLGQLEAVSPGEVNWKQFKRNYVRLVNLEGWDQIVPEGVEDKGPEVEHEVMRSGSPVQPQRDEDHEMHMAAHVAELDRAANEGEDEQYMGLLQRHLMETQRLMQELAKEAQQARVAMELQAQQESQA